MIMPLKVLAYDGSFNGFISLVYFCIKKAIKPDYIINFNNFPEISVPKIKNSNILFKTKFLMSKLGKDEFKNIYYAYLSEIENIESFIISYIFRKINNDYKTEIDVIFQDIIKNVLYENSYFSNNINFSNVNNILFAEIKPYSNIILPVSWNFSNKLSNETWMIYDVLRSSAVLHLNRKNLVFNNVELEIEQKKDFISNLWENIILSKRIS